MYSDILFHQIILKNVFHFIYKDKNSKNRNSSR